MRDRRGKRRSGRAAGTLLLVGFAAVFCFAAFKLGGGLWSAHRERRDFDRLSAIVAEGASRAAGEDEAGDQAALAPNGEAASVSGDEAATKPDPMRPTGVPGGEAAILPGDGAASVPTADPGNESAADPDDEAGNEPDPMRPTGDEAAAVPDAARPTDAPAAEPTPVPTPLPEYAELCAMNPDFYGWLSIDGTVLDYPVMYTPGDPEFYLTRSFDGARSASGVPFVDAETLVEGVLCMLHGHHMKDGTMFTPLTQYAREDYWREHPLVRFDSRYERRQYAVVAAFLSRVYPESSAGAFRYYEFPDMTRRDGFDEYAAQVRRAALYDTGVGLAFGDELLVLSTCNYHTSDGRFVVVARRVTEEEASSIRGGMSLLD